MKKEEHELHKLTNTTNKEKIIYKDLSFRIYEERGTRITGIDECHK